MLIELFNQTAISKFIPKKKNCTEWPIVFSPITSLSFIFNDCGFLFGTVTEFIAHILLFNH